MNSFLLSMVLLLNLAVCQSDDYVVYQHNVNNPFSYFGSKTAYGTVSAKQDYAQLNCNPVQLWLLSRHGTRHPSDIIIDKIAGLNEYKDKITEKSTLSQEQIEAIRTWQYNLTRTDGNQLNSQGVDDLSSLGLRLQRLYSNIFNETFNRENFEVLSSPKSRCVDSARSFLKSAFGADITDIPIIDGDDLKLNVSKFRQFNDDNDTTLDMNSRYTQLQELQKFQRSEEMQRLMHGVSNTMGLNHTLSLDTILLMYESCRYEKSWHVRSSPAWCAVFSQEDLDVLEYREDLNYYYSTGYGDPFNERVGCPVVKDLVEKFRLKSRSRLGPKGVFYFGHTSNVLGAVVRLGFARDAGNLTGENYGTAGDRRWRLSYLDPFASNLMAVLYECPNGGDKVTFYVNGVPATIEKYGCTLCPWQIIDDMLDPVVSSPACTFQDAMSSRAGTAAVPGAIVIIVTLVAARSFLRRDILLATI